MNKLLMVGAAAALLAGTFELVSQHRELVALRAMTPKSAVQSFGAQPAVKPAGTEMEREVMQLRAEVAALKSAQAATTPPSLPPAPPPTKNRVPVASAAGLGTPPNTAANQKKKTQYDQRYGAFLAQRGLTREQIERVYDLFILQDNAREDLQTSVRELGMQGNAQGVEELRSKLYAPITHELRDILSDDGYEAYNRFQRTSYYRIAYVDRMQPVFASANSALTAAQTDLLIGLVSENDRPIKISPSDIGSESRIDWEAVANKTTAFLNPQQQLALQAYISAENARRR